MGALGLGLEQSCFRVLVQTIFGKKNQRHCDVGGGGGGGGKAMTPTLSASIVFIIQNI